MKHRGLVIAAILAAAVLLAICGVAMEDMGDSLQSNIDFCQKVEGMLDAGTHVAPQTLIDAGRLCN